MTSGIPGLDPVVSDDALPDKVDVAVIGGGIVGASTALSLAEAGVSVALFEKGEIGAEQSSRNWGWVRQMGRDPAEIPLAIESRRLWQQMRQRVGADTGYRQTGIVYLCTTKREVAEHEDWLGHARQHDLDSRLLRGDDLAEFVPGARKRFLAGLHTRSDGRAEPSIAAPAIANGARRHGARIFTGCAVRGIDMAAGRVSRVVTERGAVSCSTAVLAGGAWSRLFAGNTGIDFPQLKVLGSVARVEGVDGVPDMPVGGANFSFCKRLDGGFTIAMRNANIAPIVPDSFRLFTDFAPMLIRQWHEIRIRIGRRFLEEWHTPRHWQLDQISPFERVRVLDPAASEDLNRKGLANLAAVLPAFANARVTHNWSGLIDVTPDAVPVIGAVDAIPGFYLATGFSGHGFGVGPGAGQLMADLVRGVPPCVDPSPFRLSRFGKTQKAERHPAAAARREALK